MTVNRNHLTQVFDNNYSTFASAVHVCSQFVSFVRAARELSTSVHAPLR